MRSVTSFPRYRHEARWTIACGHCSLKMSCALIAGKREAAQLQSDEEDADLTSHSKLNVQSCHDATPSLRPLANLQARGMQHVQILQQHSLQDSDADIWTILGKFLAAGVSLSVSEHLKTFQGRLELGNYSLRPSSCNCETERLRSTVRMQSRWVLDAWRRFTEDA